MERRFELRLEELLEDAVLDPRIPEGMLDRLERFVEPFAARLTSSEQRQHAREYVAGLFSDVKRKNSETIAYLHDQDRQAMQKFIGQSPWDDRPLIGELARQVGSGAGRAGRGARLRSLGVQKAREGFGRRGTAMVRASGEDRQLPGGRVSGLRFAQGARLGGRAAVSEQGVGEGQEAAEEVRRSPRDSLSDATRPGPGDARRTRDKSCPTPGLPETTKWGVARHFAGICGLWKNGICWPCRRTPWSATWTPNRRRTRGRGRRPQVPFMRVDRWCEALPEEAWTTIDVRDGARGPLVVQAVKTRVQAKTDRRRNGPEETLVILREVQDDGTMKHDYYLSNASAETPLAEFARVAKAEHRIEECLERAKGEAGLAQYQVRNWIGWHHHQTLSLLAAWFLTQEDLRGKKIHPGADGTEGSDDHRRFTLPRPRLRLSGLHRAAQHSR